MKKILTELMFAGTNALVSPVLTFGLLIFFEKIFKITTDLTLLELSNSDSPLLRDLAQKAAGTYNHSIVLGSLAETTAIAIHANSLLAKVGAYYHDLGKGMSPKAFAENQGETLNIHDEISPEESVRIIREHVTLGMEIARKNHLPQEIIDFIPSHHGTTVINYFYDKAVRMYGESKVNINDYRHLGPKPSTRETAIVMLADTCESAFRSMNNPEPEKVENLVRKLIDARLADGQLDDSPLTYKDLEIIRKTFVSVLISQSYRRIRYPNQDKLERAD
ncbi:MAG: HDIG domain-containing protein [Ignavibacteriales bacterium]|nr:HDIG domain-containing protein [Ignavibacteriales bacterium]